MPVALQSFRHMHTCCNNNNKHTEPEHCRTQQTIIPLSSPPLHRFLRADKISHVSVVNHCRCAGETPLATERIFIFHSETSDIVICGGTKPLPITWTPYHNCVPLDDSFHKIYSNPERGGSSRLLYTAIIASRFLCPKINRFLG